MTSPITPSFAYDVAGFVLAGGQSSRMGSDKALALFGAIPLIQNALNIVRAAWPGNPEAPRIAGSRTDLSSHAVSIADTWPDVGPLGGIHAALSITQSEWNLFLPVDIPLIPAFLLRLLIERARITGAPVIAFNLAGRLEPYPVLLHCSVLSHLTKFLQEGKTAGYQAWKSITRELTTPLDAPSIENLVQAGQLRTDSAEDEGLSLPPIFWFKSANNPAELALLNRLRKIRQKSPRFPVS